MGSSRRRKQKAKPSGTTVKVGVVKKKSQTVKVKPELLPGATRETEWNKDATHLENFAKHGLAVDPNKTGRRGRNSAPTSAPGGGGGGKKGGAGKTLADEAIVDGDESRGAFGQMRSTGPAPPRRLTTHQRNIVGKLIEKHGHDVEAMFRDIKLNKMQHTVGVLMGLCESYHAYPDLGAKGGNRDFRAPKRRLA